MSTKKNTPQTKQAKNAKSQQGMDSVDQRSASEMASVKTARPGRTEPLAELPEFLLDSLISRSMKEDYFKFIPDNLCFVLHRIPQSVWPRPTPMELAKLIAECGWAGESDGTKRAMNLLWDSAFATCSSQLSAESWVNMLKSEASQLAKDTNQKLTKYPDTISHSEFIGLFNTNPLTIGGEKIRGQDLFDHWIQLLNATNYLSSDTLSQLRDDLPNFHANMKKHRVRAKDWSSPHGSDWLGLSEIVREFSIWRNKTAEKNLITGKANLWSGNTPPDETTPAVEATAAGKTNQVKKTDRTRKATQEKEVIPTEAKKVSKAADAALSSANSGKASSRKAKEKSKRQKRSRNPT